MLKSKPISSALIPIVCIVLAILPATARAQASRLYMPVLSASDGLDVGLALSNPTNRLIFPKVTSNPSTANWLTLINTGDQAINRVAISLFENSGRLVAQGYFPLQPRAVLSGRITDLFVNLGPFDGYAVAEAT